MFLEMRDASDAHYLPNVEASVIHNVMTGQIEVFLDEQAVVSESPRLVMSPAEALALYDELGQALDKSDSAVRA